MLEVSWLAIASLVLIVTPGPGLLAWLDRASGAVLIGLGLKPALERRA